MIRPVLPGVCIQVVDCTHLLVKWGYCTMNRSNAKFCTANVLLMCTRLLTFKILNYDNTVHTKFHCEDKYSKKRLLKMNHVHKSETVECIESSK